MSHTSGPILPEKKCQGPPVSIYYRLARKPEKIYSLHTCQKLDFEIYKNAIKKEYLATTGCPKKNSDPRLNGHKGHQNLTKDKSRVSFEKFRNFPV